MCQQLLEKKKKKKKKEKNNEKLGPTALPSWNPLLGEAEPLPLRTKLLRSSNGMARAELMLMKGLLWPPPSITSRLTPHASSTSSSSLAPLARSLVPVS